MSSTYCFILIIVKLYQIVVLELWDFSHVSQKLCHTAHVCLKNVGALDVDVPDSFHVMLTVTVQVDFDVISTVSNSSG